MTSGGINGHQSNFDSEEDEFSDTYDHIGDVSVWTLLMPLGISENFEDCIIEQQSTLWTMICYTARLAEQMKDRGATWE